MMRMAIGKRLFKKYVEKFTKMKLLIKVITSDGNIDFGIDTKLYEKLVLVLDSFKSTMQAFAMRCSAAVALCRLLIWTPICSMSGGRNTHWNRGSIPSLYAIIQRSF